jgi:hypothetical protein
VYYLAIVVDLLFRMAWVLVLSPLPVMVHPEMMLVLFGLLEIVRCAAHRHHHSPRHGLTRFVG